MHASVPYTLDAVRVYATLGAELFAHGVRRTVAGVNLFDVQLFDGDGNTLVEVEGYVKHEVEDSSLDRSTDAEGRSLETSEGLAEDQRIAVSQPGDLESIGPQKFMRRPPGVDEVQIEVIAAGLNFRDVLVALGQLPDEDGHSPVIGAECSGIVRAMGDGVSDLRPGDPVVALVAGQMDWDRAWEAINAP